MAAENPNEEKANRQLGETVKNLAEVSKYMKEFAEAAKKNETSMGSLFYRQVNYTDFLRDLTNTKDLIKDENRILEALNKEMSKSVIFSKSLGTTLNDAVYNIKKMNNAALEGQNKDKYTETNVGVDFRDGFLGDLADKMGMSPEGQKMLLKHDNLQKPRYAEGNSMSDMLMSAGQKVVIDQSIKGKLLGGNFGEVIKEIFGQFSEETKDALSSMMMGGKNEKEDMFTRTDDLVGQVKKINLDLGITGNRTKHNLDNIVAAAQTVGELNMDWRDLVSLQKEYSAITENANLLMGDELYKMGEMAKGTNMSFQQVAGLVGKFQLMGKTFDSIHKNTKNVVDLSEKYGVNSSSVLKTITSNIEKLNKYNFKNGVDGMFKMAAEAERMKINLTESLNSLDKARGLDDALELSASLQALGGQFANADPFRLMFLARNDAEGFQEELHKMTSDIGTFNKKTGEITIGSAQIDQLEVFSKLSGKSFDSLKKEITMQRIMQEIKRENNELTEEQIIKLANIAKFEDGRYKVQTDKGQKTDVASLTSNDWMKLDNMQSGWDDRAMAGQNIAEFNDASAKTLNSSLYRFADALDDYSASLVDNKKSLAATFADAGVEITKAKQIAAGLVGASGLAASNILKESGKGKDFNVSSYLKLFGEVATDQYNKSSAKDGAKGTSPLLPDQGQKDRGSVPNPLNHSDQSSMNTQQTEKLNKTLGDVSGYLATLNETTKKGQSIKIEPITLNVNINGEVFKTLAKQANGQTT